MKKNRLKLSLLWQSSRIFDLIAFYYVVVVFSEYYIFYFIRSDCDEVCFFSFDDIHQIAARNISMVSLKYLRTLLLKWSY